ncbi:hypothetical protein QYE76_055075 [Lolium multiflorum]|uniref:Uncharacterized protein n=1 Tax=Lolium multiflorum TaxID=4521 RepID=A0AAD8SYZ2_LOLMU|nr:hypothetical protein QYE76_055075 [Lolium multiflorum]
MTPKRLPRAELGQPPPSLAKARTEASTKKTPARRHNSGTRVRQLGKTTTQKLADLPSSASKKSRGGTDAICTLDLATSKSAADKVANLAKPMAETQEPITSSSAVPLVLGEGYDLSSLLTFDPESIEPATSKASEESGPSATHGQLQHLKALLSSSIETLVEDPEEVKSILEDIQPHLPTNVSGLMRKRFWTPKPPLSTAELETLRKELEDLEERVRATKQLIQDKEALIAHSHEEAEGLKAELKTDLAEIRALNKQLVTGKDEDDEAEIAKVDRVRADALHALEAFLRRASLCNPISLLN